MKYKNPPVIETVLSVQFKPIRGLSAAHLGVFWESLGEEWPTVNDAPAVEPVFERFEVARQWEPESFGIRLSQQVDVRLQIRNRTKDRMIQVQNGRFFYNWLGSEGGPYPSYDVVRPEFDKYWHAFCQFLAAQYNESSVEPNQWEILYVNHLPQGTVWNCPSDLSGVFTFLGPISAEEIDLKFEAIGGEWNHVVGDKRGRLHIRLGRKNNDEGPPATIVLTLLARGPVGERETSINSGLELGHKTITKAFDHFTTPEAKKHWGLTNAND